MGHRAGLELVVGALELAGLPVALTAADITPPVVYVRLATDEPMAGTLGGDYPTSWAVYWIPIRGTQDAYAEADAADAVVAALETIPADVAPLSQSTVTVNEATSWPCLRWEATVQT